MNFRLSLVALVAVGCCIISPTECVAQRHPSRSRKTLETPPLPPTIRLVQALDEDLDDVLGTAKDLLDELDPGSSSDSNLGLDFEDMPKPATTGSENPNLPRTLDEYRRDRQRQADDAELDIEALTGNADDDEDADSATDSRYQDVNPPPLRRRPRPNIPYSLGDVLRDEDEIDPCCEQEFCRRMWECAGGRCQSSWQRLNRDRQRQKLVRNSCNNPDCLQTPFSEPFVCPKRNQSQPGQGYGGNVGGLPRSGQVGGLPRSGQYEVISDRAYSEGSASTRGDSPTDQFELQLEEIQTPLPSDQDGLKWSPIPERS